MDDKVGEEMIAGAGLSPVLFRYDEPNRNYPGMLTFIGYYLYDIRPSKQLMKSWRGG